MKAPILVVILLGSILLAGCDEPTSGPVSKGNAIVGGTIETGYPAVGAVLFSNGLCTGTLISSKVILTAAHCLDGGAGEYFLIGGSVDKPTYTLALKTVEKHPNYKSSVWENGAEIGYHDIAVAVLKEAAPVAAMAWRPETMTDSMIDDPITFVGYGNTTTNPWQDTAGTKHKVIVTLGDIWSQGFWNYTSPKNPKNTCSGDSGGPAFYTEGGLEKVIGVVSSGDPYCAQDGYNTRVDVNAEWVNQMLAKYDPDYTGPDCGNDKCEAGETAANCPADCDSGPVCGNDNCEAGETEANCPADCASGPVCGNGTCEAGETEANCADDCAAPAGLWEDCQDSGDCGDGLLCLWGLSGDKNGNCSDGCEQVNSYDGCPEGYFCIELSNAGEAGIPGACIPEDYIIICGNGECQSPQENEGNCPQDCSTEPVDDICKTLPWQGCCDGEVVKYCENGTYKEADCNKQYGPSCGWSSQSGYYSCKTDGGADPSGDFPKSCDIYTGPECGNGTCETGETTTSCPADCKPAGPVCGNNKCETGETSVNCPKDCSSGAPVCGNGKCETGETEANCAKDCTTAAAVCGNNKCEVGETETNCPADCSSSSPVCGDGKCETGETTISCPADCKPEGPWCGDGTCDATETSQTCLADCGAAGPVCGDDKCEDPENKVNCPADCGTNPEECGQVVYTGCCDGNKVTWCENGVLKTQDCTGSPSCGWNEAAGIYDCNTAGASDALLPKACDAQEQSYKCGNGVCEVGENGYMCPADCSAEEGECGNNVCEGREDCVTCPSDCGYCYDDDVVSGSDDTISFTSKKSGGCAVNPISNGGGAGGLGLMLLGLTATLARARRRVVNGQE